jgi:SHS2 domain-containing protein
LFGSAAQGFAALLCDPATVTPRESVQITASAPDVETLMVGWLSEINYRFEVEHFAFRSFDVHEISHTKVAATGLGERIDPARHVIGAQVKSVTYHRLEVKRTAGGWSARVIVDI